MKKLILTAVAVFAVASTSMFATPTNDYDDIIVNVKKVDNKSIRLLMANLEQETTKITIDNQRGTNYYTNYVRNHNGFKQKINLENLPNGRYYLNVSRNGEKISYLLKVTNDGLLYSKPFTDKKDE